MAHEKLFTEHLIRYGNPVKSSVHLKKDSVISFRGSSCLNMVVFW